MTTLGPLPPVGTPTITLVEGACFAISTTSGEMEPEHAHGLFYRDTRFVSGLRLLLDGREPEPLSAQPQAPYETTFLARRPDVNSAPLLVSRHRLVGEGMREDITLRNLGGEDTVCQLQFEFETDFADMFSVKDGRPKRLGEVTWSSDDDTLAADAEDSEQHRGVRIHLDLDGASFPSQGVLTISPIVPAHGEWKATLQIHPVVDHEMVQPAFPHAEPLTETQPAARLRAWRHGSPTIDLPGDRLDAVLDRSVEDLGALRIQLKDENGLPADAVAAGAPWFMTLFGRDSLLTAWMALPVDPDLALSTLRVLARLQGTEANPLNEEQPGRILHEVRHGYFPLSPGKSVYYGTIDATPLFCMLVGELHRWGIPDEALRPLLPHVDRALEWIVNYGDRDGDDFVEYKRFTDRGLLNQGWKDSGDSMVFADGRQAEPPIALAEVQGYAYAAYNARAELARTFDDEETAKRWSARAERLRQRFHEAFWLPDRGYFALGLDAEKRPMDSLASNMGHCLWTGIVDPALAGQVAAHLVSPEMFSGWGIRTLASSMPTYDPASYQRGSVWPHDTALCVAGLARYGFTKEAHQVAEGMLEAAVAFGGRLPELFCGFPRADFPYPVPYPTSCSPQAWAAATPVMLLRTLLGFEPDIPRGKVHLVPDLPRDFGRIEVSNLPLAGNRVQLTAEDGTASLSGLPERIEVVRVRPVPSPLKGPTS
ncbi:amylo-alpha-1,6-glucosidase [Flindersiella endophytica]